MKTVLITGSSRGIGRDIAKRLAKEEYRIIINYNKSEKEAKELEKEIREMGRDSLAIKADVTNFSEVEDMFNEVAKRFKGVDILINNAGISSYALFQDIDEKTWDNIFDVNVKGVYNAIHAALPYMLSKHSGKILNMSSIWGIVGGSMESHYSATKGAINALTKAHTGTWLLWYNSKCSCSRCSWYTNDKGNRRRKFMYSIWRNTNGETCHDRRNCRASCLYDFRKKFLYDWANYFS